MIVLEFGRPRTSAQAWIRIPDDTHPDYKTDSSSYEHCAYIKRFIIQFIDRLERSGGTEIPLDNRMISVETDDLRLLFQVNSFYRNLETAFTVDWACLGINKSLSVWNEFLPSGNDNYRWWQITTFKPETRFLDYHLYCIEMNSQFLNGRKTEFRFNEHSKFKLVFAKEEEIEALKEELSWFIH